MVSFFCCSPSDVVVGHFDHAATTSGQGYCVCSLIIFHPQFFPIQKCNSSIANAFSFFSRTCSRFLSLFIRNPHLTIVSLYFFPRFFSLGLHERPTLSRFSSLSFLPHYTLQIMSTQPVSLFDDKQRLDTTLDANAAK